MDEEGLDEDAAALVEEGEAEGDVDTGSKGVIERRRHGWWLGTEY